MDNTFKNHPDLQEYFETSDGTQFYKEDVAKNHAKSLEDKTVKKVSRPEEKEKQLSAAEIITLVPEMDFDQATQYLTSENLLAKPRKSVVDALTAKLEALK